MARRITYRLLIFGSLISALLFLILHSLSYGLSREAQFDALQRKLGGWPSNNAPARVGSSDEMEHVEDVDPTDNTFSSDPPPRPKLELAKEPPAQAPPAQAPPAQEPPAQAPPAPPAEAPPSPPPPAAQLPPSLVPPAQAFPAHFPPTSPPPSPLPQTNHTRALVLARTTAEIPITSWLSDDALTNDRLLSLHPYTVDAIYPPTDPNVPDDTVPANRGHEAMPYLTHIINYYDSPKLADVSLFMHAHRYTWHNNDLLDSDAIATIQRLSSPTVLRAGYFNLRCHLDPGCPAHLHPATTEFHPNRPEEREIGAAWAKLFPGETVPEVLSQPCCSQFALSRDRIRSHPLSTYLRLRQWLLDTELDDALAGRVFEYVWQKLWLGLDEWCPDEHTCYCDGYGICFGGNKPFEHWFDMRKEWRELQPEVGFFKHKDQVEPGNGWLSSEKAVDLLGRVEGLRREMDDQRTTAFLRGNEPRERAVEAGRTWKDGDGF